MLKNLIVFCFIFVFVCLPVQAITFITDINIDQPTILKGYTVTSEDQNFRLGIYPEVLAEETRVVVKQFDNTEFEYPENWSAISDVYEFDIFNKQAFQNEKPLIIRINTFEQTRHLKKIFFWNGVIGQWVELPSETVDNQTIKSVLHLPYAKMIVLKHDEILELGHASWYKYKNCLCAANPDYPKGTKLKVTRLLSDASIIVEVNDYGPELSTGRIIDLDISAFEQLGSTSAGLIYVKVEPYDSNL